MRRILEINEHKSTSYAPRTWANASKGQITIAFAVEFDTAGEKLTETAAKNSNRPIYQAKLDKNFYSVLNQNPDEERLAVSLASSLPSVLRLDVINIAGNSIATFGKFNYCQEDINVIIYLTLKQLFGDLRPAIITGGQTGADLAGAVAGYALGCETSVLLPNGYLQRNVFGVDEPHTEFEIFQQISQGAVEILDFERRLEVGKQIAQQAA